MELKQYVLRMWEDVFNAHDAEAIDALVADGAVIRGVPVAAAGPEGVREVFAQLWAGFSDLVFDVEELLADGDRVACIGTMRGTHDGEFLGVEATGRRFAAKQIHVLAFDAEGRMTEHLAVRDDLAMLHQLGIAPPVRSGA